MQILFRTDETPIEHQERCIVQGVLIALYFQFYDKDPVTK